MIRIAVASGKGGTGKTIVAASLALAMAREGPVQLLDCDVEAPNAALFLHPAIEIRQPVTLPVPVVEEPLCDHCGECSAFCRFNALAVTPPRVLVFPELCKGCGGCALVCPRQAITQAPRPVGCIEEGTAAGGIRLTQGRLNTGEIATVHVIRAVRRRQTAAAAVIIDSPPGASCPMVAAVEGVDLVLLVAEPSPFGLHDLKLAAEAVAALGLPRAVVINRDSEGCRLIDRFCETAGLPVVGRIPDSRAIAETYSRGELPLASIPAFRRSIEAIVQALPVTA